MAVPTHRENLKTRLVEFTNRVLLLLEKRRKTKLTLVCLQYANLYSTATLVFLFKIILSHFSQHGSKLDNQGDFKMPVEGITI